MKKSSVSNGKESQINIPIFTPSEEEKKILERYVKPHALKSRDVLESDLLRVAEEAKVLYLLCFLPHGRYPGAEAMAHPQIDDKDPLKLFVTQSKKIIINPEIINHTNTLIEKFEGCLSFENEEMVKVDRWNKITIKYQTLTPEGKLSDWITENVNGLISEVYQHETQHLGLIGDNNYIYKITE